MKKIFHSDEFFKKKLGSEEELDTIVLDVITLK